MPTFPTASLEVFLRRIRDIPSLPEVVNRIIQLLGQPDTPASEIAHLISYDPGLTTKVLRMVNSAAYGFPRQISSIQHAIMILGFGTARGLVLSASIFQLFREGKTLANNPRQRAFWEHSLETAFAARVIGQQLHLAASEDAFSAGMLHDVGRMILEVFFQSKDVDLLQILTENGLPPDGNLSPEQEREAYGLDHMEVGMHIATKWKLPVAITEVIQYHHRPEEAPLCKPLVYWIALADELSHRYQQHREHLELSHFSPHLREYFTLTGEMIRRLADGMKKERETAGDWLNMFDGEGANTPDH